MEQINILIFMPEGVEAGEYIASPKLSLGKEQFYAGTKGEFPFLLTAISCLKENWIFGGSFSWCDALPGRKRSADS